MLWSVLYNYFIFEDKFGSIEHTVSNHEEYMSLQLWSVENLSLQEIEHYINEILLKCSIELNLNFKVVTLNEKINSIGKAGEYGLQVHSKEFEYIPLMYLNNALHSSDVRLAYLSYYQVLEYFFIRVQNLNLIEDIREGNFINSSNVNHKKLKYIMKKYVNTLSERESLKLVLKASLDINKIKSWVNESEELKNLYINGQGINIDFSKNQDKIIAKIAERIYFFRCAIAHAKGDIDEYMAIPEQSDEVIKRELELMKIIAFDTLKYCSRITA